MLMSRGITALVLVVALFAQASFAADDVSDSTIVYVGACTGLGLVAETPNPCCLAADLKWRPGFAPRIDAGTGRLQTPGAFAKRPAPVCAVFVPPVRGDNEQANTGD